MSEVVLASKGPRRRQLLSLLLADFRCSTAMDVDPSPPPLWRGAENYVLKTGTP